MRCRRSAAGMREAGGRAKRRSGGAGGRDRADRWPRAKPAPGGSMPRKRRRAHETVLPDGQRRRDRHPCRVRDVRPERAARRRIRPARPTPAPPARRDAAARARCGGRARSGRPPARRGRRARAARRRCAQALLHVCRPPNTPSCPYPRSGSSSVTRIGAKGKENIPLAAANPSSPLRNRNVDDASTTPRRFRLSRRSAGMTTARGTPRAPARCVNTTDPSRGEGWCERQRRSLKRLPCAASQRRWARSSSVWSARA